jgi:D-sedoheptulose 7-phosphate isomerase
LRLAATAHEETAVRSAEAIAATGVALAKAVAAGRAVLVFGNGGSAAAAQHFVAELVVRYERDRPALRAVALTTDTSIVTAAGNDTGFDQVFARQVEALGQPGDVALGITTSGRSPNVLRALEAAGARGMVTVALTGRDGGEAGRLAQFHVSVGHERTAIAQEVHTTVLHAWCELIDDALVKGRD